MKKNKIILGIYQEFKRINWISGKDLVNLLIIVVITVFLSSMFTLGIDYVIHNFVKFLISL